jgi:hypothetical protein
MFSIFDFELYLNQLCPVWVKIITVLFSMLLLSSLYFGSLASNNVYYSRRRPESSQSTHTQFPLNSSNFSYTLFWPLFILTVLKISCHLNTNVGEKSMVLNALYQWNSDVINVSLYNQYPWDSKNTQMLKM